MRVVDMKGLVLRAIFSRWPHPRLLEDGYTILLPSPMDMPFLLRYALEGLAGVDTSHCRQILVVPDGWGDDRGEALRQVIRAFDDPRIELVGLTALDYLVVRLMGKTGSAPHWLAIVNGTARARCEYISLHDSDAFFVEFGALERQYRECRDRGLYTLGVTPRWDPFFEQMGYTIPGTWEMMYSTRWARSRTPLALKGRSWPTPHGAYVFDTMLYPQFLDHPSGKVGIMTPPPRLVHFNGTIVTFRTYTDRGGEPVVDELFRILLLAILEDLLPAPNGVRVAPPVAALARGLDDPDAPVTYRSAGSDREYPTFRGMIADLCEAPIFRGARADRIRALIRPFDDFFASRTAEAAVLESDDPPGEQTPRLRAHGLG
jgi:hypothetical protein